MQVRLPSRVTAPRSSRSTRAATVAAVTLLALAVIAGCSRDTGTAPASRSFDAAPSATRVEAAGAEPASLTTDALAADGATAGRSFISSATMTVKAADVGAAKARAVAAAEAAGGALFGDQTTAGTKTRSVVTLKVPPDRFRALLDELATLGTLQSQELKTEDVTTQVIDLDARVAAAASSLERTRALIDRSGSLTELAELEKEVARRTGELESLRGQQRTLHARVDLATITLTLESDAQVTPGVAEQQNKGLPGFGDGFSGGVRAATAAATLTAAAVGALVPFVPLLLLVAGLVVLHRRRRVTRGAPGATPAAG